MSEEHFQLAVRTQLRKIYQTAFRHGFFSCMCGTLLFYVFF